MSQSQTQTRTQTETQVRIQTLTRASSDQTKTQTQTQTQTQTRPRPDRQSQTQRITWPVCATDGRTIRPRTTVTVRPRKRPFLCGSARALSSDCGHLVRFWRYPGDGGLSRTERALLSDRQTSPLADMSPGRPPADTPSDTHCLTSAGQRGR